MGVFKMSIDSKLMSDFRDLCSSGGTNPTRYVKELITQALTHSEPPEVDYVSTGKTVEFKWRINCEWERFRSYCDDHDIKATHLIQRWITAAVNPPPRPVGRPPLHKPQPAPALPKPQPDPFKGIVFQTEPFNYPEDPDDPHGVGPVRAKALKEMHANIANGMPQFEAITIFRIACGDPLTHRQQAIKDSWAKPEDF
jgi:hypothetical protein